MIHSPDGRIEVTFLLEDGVPHYSVSRLGKEIIKSSRLGFVFKNCEPLNRDLAIAASGQKEIDEIWTQPWGEAKDIRNHCNELRVDLEERTGLHRRMTIVFRVYDYGLGFRYELPKQENLSEFQITDEQTEFALAGDNSSWWIPAYKDNRYEYLYMQSPISYLRTHNIRAVHTPITMETADGLFLSFHEAALSNYASMTLVPADNHTLHCDLVPWSDGAKVKGSPPHKTPWRTIQIADSAGELITSYLILNLNEPNKLGDVSWVKPGKYVGIWWGMHIGKYSWGPGPTHGATTKRAKEYIDFASKHGFSGVLIEGWNIGWSDEWLSQGDKFSFTTPYWDFDIEEVCSYAASKGVGIIGHHETVASVASYERQMEDAFEFYRDLGISAVKTGYVGWGQGIKRFDEHDRLAGLEWHHGQFMVDHYRRVVETAAKYHIMLDVHEPIKDTGIRRTYPNMMTREGARGQEYNAWDPEGGNPPEHTTVLPFTRLLAGPFDFTPGIFDLHFDHVRPNNRVNTTLAKQLALYVVIYSPMQMAADLPENYENQPALQFIVDVPADWQETKVLNAKIGDYITIVRQDRNSKDWYLGSITDEDGRELEAILDFLEPDMKYVAEIYSDADGADWQANPLAIDIYKTLVDSSVTLKLKLAPGGGQAIRIRPATENEAEEIPPYRSP